MTEWPQDNVASLIKFYGNPGTPGKPAPAWFSKNIVKIIPPFKMHYGKDPMSAISVHRLCAPAFMAAFNEIFEACGHDQKKVDATGASDYAGCYNLRYIAGTKRLSNHSFACAIDLAAATNGFRYDKSTTLSKIVIDAFKRQGARWGGDYKGRKDPMHFEFVRSA